MLNIKYNGNKVIPDNLTRLYYWFIHSIKQQIKNISFT